MKQKKRKPSEELYTFAEFKKKFFPNVKIESVEDNNKESFLDILKKIRSSSRSMSSKQKSRIR